MNKDVYITAEVATVVDLCREESACGANTWLVSRSIALPLTLLIHSLRFNAMRINLHSTGDSGHIRAEFFPLRPTSVHCTGYCSNGLASWHLERNDESTRGFHATGSRYTRSSSYNLSTE